MEQSWVNILERAEIQAIHNSGGCLFLSRRETFNNYNSLNRKKTPVCKYYKSSLMACHQYLRIQMKAWLMLVWNFDGNLNVKDTRLKFKN